MQRALAVASSKRTSVPANAGPTDTPNSNMPDSKLEHAAGKTVLFLITRTPYWFDAGV